MPMVDFPNNYFTTGMGKMVFTVCIFIVYVHHHYMYVSDLIVYILGIAMFRPFMFRAENQITDYSNFTQPFTFNDRNTFFRCATGLGPSGADSSTELGGWYLNGAQIPVNASCGRSVFQVRATNDMLFPGGIDLFQCGTFTTTEEGVYSCIMMNSSMMEQTMRVGVYFSGRSKSLDVYPITSLLTIFHLSTQLLQ